jgi:hypothetical protein
MRYRISLKYYFGIYLEALGKATKTVREEPVREIIFKARTS